ncbi:MAG TPA: hypothetical protein VLS96_13390 [Nodosilinea sp.]|nr:hypothetical protein [Nodosilinea sp.]
MSSTDLTLLSTDQAVLNLEEASVEVVPDEAFLSSNSLLSILAAFDPEFADLVAGFAADLPDASGQVTVTGGLFDASLQLADGTALVGSFDAPATLRSFAALAAESNGTVTLNGGILEAAIATDTESATLAGFDLAAVTSTLVLDAINAIDATVPFTNGAFSLDVATALGPITGLVDVAGGDLNLDLATPFGQIVADIDFGEEALFPFSAPVPLLGTIDGVVDFNSGNLTAPLGVFGDLVVPISDFSGSLTLTDGVASLDTAVPLTAGISLPVATDIELGPLASEYVAGFIQDLNGAGTLTNGVLDATLESPLGLFEITFDVAAFTNQGADFFAGIDGTIGLGGGLATADLTTPLGNINDSFDLTTLSPALEAPLAELV